MYQYNIKDFFDNLSDQEKELISCTQEAILKPLIWSIFFVDLGTNEGSIQSGVRPAIVYNNFAVDPRITRSIVIPLTSQLDKKYSPVHTLIKRSEQNGLAKDSIALVEQITSIDNSQIIKPLGFLSLEDIEIINEKVKIQIPALGLLPEEEKKKLNEETNIYYRLVQSSIKRSSEK